MANAPNLNSAEVRPKLDSKLPGEFPSCMANFMVYALDKPDREIARLAARDAHRARLREHDHPIRVMIGGPLLDDDGGMVGTMLVVEAASMDLVRRFVDQDPYVCADVYASVAIHPFNWGLGNPSLQGA